MIIVSVLVLNHKFTPLGLAGCTTAIGGVMAYSILKARFESTGVVVPVGKLAEVAAANTAAVEAEKAASTAAAAEAEAEAEAAKKQQRLAEETAKEKQEEEGAEGGEGEEGEEEGEK